MSSFKVSYRRAGRSYSVVIWAKSAGAAEAELRRFVKRLGWPPVEAIRAVVAEARPLESEA